MTTKQQQQQPTINDTNTFVAAASAAFDSSSDADDDDNDDDNDNLAVVVATAADNNNNNDNDDNNDDDENKNINNNNNNSKNNNVVVDDNNNTNNSGPCIIQQEQLKQLQLQEEEEEEEEELLSQEGHNNSSSNNNNVKNIHADANDADGDDDDDDMNKDGKRKTTTTTIATTTMTTTKPTKPKQKQKTYKILSSIDFVIIILSYMLGTIWTLLHPLMSIITGEFHKCRGIYVDEKAMLIGYYRSSSSNPIVNTPSSILTLPTFPTNDEVMSSSSVAASSWSLCDALEYALPNLLYSNSGNVQCLRHSPSAFSSSYSSSFFHIVKITPSMVPVEPNESIVFIVNTGNNNDDDDDNVDLLLGMIITLINRLSNMEISPWLAKTVFLVMPSLSYH